jgi:hypothetical protein
MCNESFRSLDFRPDPRYDKGMKEPELTLPVYDTLETLLAVEWPVAPEADAAVETEEEDGPGWDLFGWDGTDED